MAGSGCSDGKRFQSAIDFEALVFKNFLSGILINPPDFFKKSKSNLPLPFFTEQPRGYEQIFTGKKNQNLPVSFPNNTIGLASSSLPDGYLIEFFLELFLCGLFTKAERCSPSDIHSQWIFLLLMVPIFFQGFLLDLQALEMKFPLLSIKQNGPKYL